MHIFSQEIANRRANRDAKRPLPAMPNAMQSSGHGSSLSGLQGIICASVGQAAPPWRAGITLWRTRRLLPPAPHAGWFRAGRARLCAP